MVRSSLPFALKPVAGENSQNFATPPLVSPQNERKNSVLSTCLYPNLGYVASDWFKEIFNQSESLLRVGY